jgi:hypothetical protein
LSSQGLTGRHQQAAAEATLPPLLQQQHLCCAGTQPPTQQQPQQRRRRPRKLPVLGVKAEAGCLVRATTMALQLLRLRLPGAQLRSRQQVALEASVDSIARSMAAIIRCGCRI